ncbi:hypothetical protein [Tepidibacter hydrothermalis]|uniref:Uncharacterized protein n=1 Tax=Tepidibacter hydrothermalis TaxID=3036126 RepID=A0ABY8EB69_9FIRM|nr:hypothetical protein [Tepidibacter hydrothermalis]WFD09029.1 hypothetical protein P4S50_11595 [Tepidibacter hydrothermalis]
MKLITIENILLAILIVTILFTIFKYTIGTSTIVLYWEFILIVIINGVLNYAKDATGVNYLEIKYFIMLTSIMFTLIGSGVIVEMLKGNLKNENSINLKNTIKVLIKILNNKIKQIKPRILLEEYEAETKKDCIILLANLLNYFLEIYLGFIFILILFKAIKTNGVTYFTSIDEYSSLLFVLILVQLLVSLNIPKTILSIRYRSKILLEREEMSIFISHAIALIEKGMRLQDIMVYNCIKVDELNDSLKKIGYRYNSNEEILLEILNITKFRLNSEELITKVYILINKLNLNLEESRILTKSLDEVSTKHGEIRYTLGFEIISILKKVKK